MKGRTPAEVKQRIEKGPVGPVHVYAGLMRCAKSEPVLQTGGNGIVFVGNARRITAN